MSKIEIYRTENGQYRGRLYDDAGEVVQFRPGTVGGKRTASEHAASRDAVQIMLKSAYERQEAAKSGG